MRVKSPLALIALCMPLSVVVAACGFASAGNAGGADRSGGHGTRLLVYATGGYGLALTDRSGHVLRLLSTAHYGTWGTWSPNGALIGWKDPGGIHVENADGSHLRLLVPMTRPNVSFIWSPNSRSLIVGGTGPKRNQLWQVPLGRHPAKVLASTSRPGVLFRPDFFTPSGDLVYEEFGTGPSYFGSAVRELSVATGRARIVWSASDYEAATREPIMSPKLRKWAYIRTVGNHQQLRILDRTSGQSHIVEGVDPTNLVAWSPDSRSLAVIEDANPDQHESGRRVVTIVPNGRLQHHIGAGQTVFWGRDGELFVLRGPYDQVWASRNGGPERLLFRLSGHNVISVDSN